MDGWTEGGFVFGINLQWVSAYGGNAECRDLGGGFAHAFCCKAGYGMVPYRSFFFFFVRSSFH